MSTVKTTWAISGAQIPAAAVHLALSNGTTFVSDRLMATSRVAARVQAVSLDRKGAYTERFVTQRYSVPFFAKSGGDFQHKYPLGSGSRVRLEQVHFDHHTHHLRCVGGCGTDRLHLTGTCSLGPPCSGCPARPC